MLQTVESTAPKIGYVITSCSSNSYVRVGDDNLFDYVKDLSDATVFEDIESLMKAFARRCIGVRGAGDFGISIVRTEPVYQATKVLEAL